MRILPHRPPILLVDSIDYVDSSAVLIRGNRRVDPDDPVFEGHFPDTPVYPGTYLIEMIGQLSLCLYYFVRKNTDSVDEAAVPIDVRATKILGAHFLSPVGPGDDVSIEAIGIDDDGFFGRAAGQAVVNGQVACVAVGEVCFP